MMASRALFLLGVPALKQSHFDCKSASAGFLVPFNKTRQCSTRARASVEPPDVHRLAETARISLTPEEVEVCAPKIRQVIDWFGQLQSVDLRSIEPAIRADTESDNLREDVPDVFENRDSLISSAPSYEEPYIKVPKILNKE